MEIYLYFAIPLMKLTPKNITVLSVYGACSYTELRILYNRFSDVNVLYTIEYFMLQLFCFSSLFQ